MAKEEFLEAQKHLDMAIQLHMQASILCIIIFSYYKNNNRDNTKSYNNNTNNSICVKAGVQKLCPR